MAIEIGKQYEIINSVAGNDGEIVTVTGYLGYCSTTSMEHGDRWFIDKMLKTNTGSRLNHAGEQQLKPLYDGNKPVSWDTLADLWQPAPITEETGE